MKVISLKRFTLRSLPVRNLTGYSGRTAALVFFSALIMVAVFGGSLLINGVQNSLDITQGRLGADILVMPAEADTEFDAQTVLSQGEPGYFYMSSEIINDVSAIPGIELISPQLFLASSKSSCCSARLQIIAFDPATDFTIQPWLEDNLGSREIGYMELVVGSNVTVYADNLLTLYGCSCHVIGRFEPTGSTLDSAVYANYDTIRTLIQASCDKGLNRYQTFRADDVVSSIMIRVRDDYSIEQVADDIRNQVPGVSVSTSKRMMSGISERVRKISGALRGVMVMIWALCLCAAVLVFILMIRERGKELATLRSIGASRSILSGMIFNEAWIVSLSGSVLGLLLSILLLSSFRTLISQILETGFVLPGTVTIIEIALLALAIGLLAGILSGAIGVFQLNRMEISLLLKEEGD